MGLFILLFAIITLCLFKHWCTGRLPMNQHHYVTIEENDMELRQLDRVRHNRAQPGMGHIQIPHAVEVPIAVRPVAAPIAPRPAYPMVPPPLPLPIAASPINVRPVAVSLDFIMAIDLQLRMHRRFDSAKPLEFRCNIEDILNNLGNDIVQMLPVLEISVVRQILLQHDQFRNYHGSVIGVRNCTPRTDAHTRYYGKYNCGNKARHDHRRKRR